MSDDINVKLIKNGSAVEFEKLVTLCEKRVYNLALRYTNNEADAMDISQEVFLRVFRSLGNFKEESSIITWVYRITVNTAIDLTRKKSRRRENSLTAMSADDDILEWDIIDDNYSPELEYDKEELREAIGEAISTLSEEHRSIIIMRDINGMSYGEISEVLSLGEGTVKSRLFRARNRLRGILEKSRNIPAGFSSKKMKGGERNE